MPRIHAFEFADQPWFPRTWADAGTAYLEALQTHLGVATLLLPLFEEALSHSPERRVIDLGSGGGGPVLGLQAAAEATGASVPVTLTDLSPNHASLERAAVRSDVTVHPTPVDATRVPADLIGLRTVFNALHHLRPHVARAVLADAQRAGQPILVVELSERAPLPVLSSLFIPLMVWFVLPLVRPLRASWLFFTYLVPVLPFTIAWDGLVSHLRTYAPAELDDLTAPIVVPGWTWTSGRTVVGDGPMAFTWLLGHPEST